MAGNDEQYSVQWNPLRGTMVSDISPEDISGGNLFVTDIDTGAYNVRNIGQNLSSDYEFILGNELAWQLSPLTLQNKVFRLYLTYDTSVSFTFRLYSPNGVPVSANFNITVGSYGNLAAFYNGMLGVLALTGQSYTLVTPLVTTSSTEGYFEFSIDTIPSWDYEVRISTNDAARVITSKEAIDQSLIGEWNLIGSWDLQGELITWWTTQTKLPFDYDIQSVTNNGSGLFRIETTVSHGLLSGERVIVKNSGAADGQWIVTVISSTEFDLQGSTYSAVTLTSFSVVTADAQGIGELGRSLRDENTQAYSYTRLIRARALNWVTKHQQDTLCKKDALRKYYRYTDDYNPVGTLYDRTINYQDDCLLSFVDPRNTYSYENIGLESQMIVGNGFFSLAFTGQTQSGGNILSGNSRFAVRLITDSLVPTTWSPLSNVVPAARSSETGTATDWSGDAAAVTTTKIDNFLVTGDLLDNYKWIQMAVVNYQGDAMVGILLPKVLITSNSMTMRWTGNEASEDLDVGTLNSLTVPYRTALSIDELDGRVILSNLTSSLAVDLTSWVQSFTHSVLRKELVPIGSRYNGTLSVNEFEKSENVYSSTGYMINETYRFAAEAEFWSGGDSLSYHIQDIKIDTDASYPRRITALPDNNLTDSGTNKVYIPYIQFSNIDWNFILPNGQRVKDVVRKIRIVRVDMTTGYREVICSGIAVMGTEGELLYTGVDVAGHTNGNLSLGGAGFTMDFPYASGVQFDGSITNEVYRLTGTLRPNIVSIYSWDLLYNETTYSPANGDTIINNGVPIQTLIGTAVGHTPSDNMLWNNFREFSGNADLASSPQNLTVTNGANVAFDQNANIGGLLYNKRAVVTYVDPLPSLYSGTFTISTPSSPVVKTSADFHNFPPNPNDFGVRMVQVYRPITDKFGDPLSSKYITTGAELSDQSVSTIDVFGGDCFTLKSWFRHRIQQGDFVQTAPDFTVEGFGGGIAFYSQCRVNAQDTDRANSPTQYKYPTISEGDWLNATSATNPIASYNEGYTIQNNITSYAAFDSDQSNVASDFPVRLIYSEKTQPEQASDMQRKFLPLNFTDLQYKDGEIVNHRVINSELCAWQPNYFSRLYFHSNALISTQDGGNVITGDGGAFTNRPLNITSYGCPNKWSIGKGRSAGGNDVAYWINPALKCFIRFGGDGTTNQGVIHGMDSFFRRYSHLLIGKDKPADGEGICCVWDEKFKEMHFSVRGWNHSAPQYDNTFNYLQGMVVQNGTTFYEQLPAFYKSKANGNLGHPTSNTTWWEPIPVTDEKYYNVYSFSFSENKNGFNYFETPKPKIYVQFQNTYLSPNPVNNTGKVYEHNKGVKGVWYDNQTADAYFDAIVNQPKNMDKMFVALWYQTLIAPYRIDLETKENISYLEKSDFKKDNSVYTSTIKKDSHVTAQNPLGLNSLRTSRIMGNYIKVRTWISHTDAYQTVTNFAVKLYDQARKINK